MAKRRSPLKGKKIGSQFNIPDGVTLSQYLGRRGTGPADSYEDALELNRDRFYNEDGDVMIITPRKVKGVANTYQISLQSERSRGRGMLDSPTSKRGQYSDLVTDPETDQELADLKRGLINRKGQQFHHMTSLAWYAPYFKGLNEDQKAQLIFNLNRRGFYPGDDRRNYVGLIGGNVAIGSEHQGQLHPRIDQLRKQSGINPERDEVFGMTVEQRLNEMLPQLYSDRDVLRSVIMANRRPDLQPGPSEVTPLTPNAKSKALPSRGELAPAPKASLAMRLFNGGVHIFEQVEAAWEAQGASWREGLSMSAAAGRKKEDAAVYATENVPLDFGVTERIAGWSSNEDTNWILNK